MSARNRVHDAPAAAGDRITITRYQRTRFWAVWLDGELLAVVLYRKGAEAIRRAWERRR